MTEKKMIKSLCELSFKDKIRIAVMAPHPDDFDAIAVTLKKLAESGALIQLAVLTGGASGVEDSFGTFSRDADKAALREDEQLASCRQFGLHEQSVTFLRLSEDADGTPVDGQTNYQFIFDYLHRLRPEIIFMPHYNDSNAGHRICYKMVRQAVEELQLELIFMLNKDPKTLAMQPGCYCGFGEEQAAWKGSLLRCHKSQHQRNLNTRRHGFDFRILDFNRQSAEQFNLPDKFAELFELQRIGQVK